MKGQKNQQVSGHILKFLRREPSPRGKACNRKSTNAAYSKQFPLSVGRYSLINTSGYFYKQTNNLPLSNRNFIKISNQGASSTGNLLQSQFKKWHLASLKDRQLGRKKGMLASFLDNNKSMKGLAPFHGLQRSFVRQDYRKNQLKQKLSNSKNSASSTLATMTTRNMFTIKNNHRQQRLELVFEHSFMKNTKTNLSNLSSYSTKL